MKPNYLRFQSTLVGNICPNSRSIDSSITMPNGFKTEFSVSSIGQVDLTLSDDSYTVTLNYQQASQCDGRALRNTARSITSIKIILIMLILNIIY